MFSQTVEYALRAMVFLASHPQEPLPAQVIAAAVRVPERYMSKVMRSLVVARLVRSQRGPRGGFMLAQAADRTSMLAVLEAVEPLPRIEKCPLDNPQHTDLCPMHRRLADAIELIRRELGRSTLAEVAVDTVSADRCAMMSGGARRTAPTADLPCSSPSSGGCGGEGGCGGDGGCGGCGGEGGCGGDEGCGGCGGEGRCGS